MNLPVAARELRVAAHDRASYRGRVWAGAIAIIATIWIACGLLDFTGAISGTIGAQIFGMQAWAAYVFACCALNVTSDSISREKRDGTLGLLFLTQLKGRDVVLGKLCSGMALYFAGALACLPILALPVLLGGIQLSQSLFLFVSILNCMLFSAAAGLFGSAVCVDRQRAGSLAIGIVFFQCAALPLIAWSMLRKGFDVALCIGLSLFSPFFAQQVGQGALLGFGRYLFALSIGLVFLQSLLLLGAAAWIAPRSWQIKDREPFLARFRNRLGAWSNRTIRSRSPLGRQLLDRNAYEWLAARRKSASRNFWEFLVATIAVSAVLIFNFSRHFEMDSVLIMVCVPAAYLVQINCKIRIGGHACGRICEDRESNALELILSTPLTLPQLIAGEFRALRRHFILPILVVVPLLFLAWRLSLPSILRTESFLFSPEEHIQAGVISFLITCAMCLYLVLDSVALAWMSVWISLSIKRPAQARAVTMIWTLTGPFIALAVIVAFLENTPLGFIVRYANHQQVLIALGSLILAWDILCIRHGRKRLRERAWQTITDPVVQSRDTPSMFATLAGFGKFWKKIPSISR